MNPCGMEGEHAPTGKELVKVRRAALRSEKLSKRVDGWSGVEEIRRWRKR